MKKERSQEFFANNGSRNKSTPPFSTVVSSINKLGVPVPTKLIKKISCESILENRSKSQ